jgi:uncharacterized membrane protein YfcA
MPNDLLLYIAIGFVAQMVDGAIGMAYGVTATPKAGPRRSRFVASKYTL